VAVIEERKHLRNKEKIHCHLRYWYFVMVNQIVMTTVEILHISLMFLSVAVAFHIVRRCLLL